MICALVLAAGRSRRMGTQKLLLPIGGQPMIARVVDEVLRAPGIQVFVVVGTDEPRLREALAGRAVHFVRNPDLDSDMLASIRCGLHALPADCDAVLLVLGDQPALSALTIEQLLAAGRASGRGIVVPVHGQQRGHPMLFAARYRDEILRRFDATGLRGLLQAHPEDICEIPVDSPDVLADVDTPEQYRRTQS